MTVYVKHRVGLVAGTCWKGCAQALCFGIGGDALWYGEMVSGL